MDINELIKIIEKGENEKIEFKKDYTNEIGKEIVAFANAEGGIILVGVNDNGEIVGYKSKKIEEKVSSLLLSIYPKPEVKINKIKINGKNILIIKVEKSKYICSIGNVAYIRIGRGKRALTINELFQLGSEKLLIPLDKQTTEVKVDELSNKCLKILNSGRIRKGLKEINKEIMKNIGIIKEKDGKEFLSFAGVICLTENPQNYFPHTYVRINYKNNWKRIGGCLFKIIDESVEEILSKFWIQSIIKENKRIDISPFPRNVIRELIVNAVAHRNYAIESEVFIYIKENEIKIVNPGSFPPGTSPEDPKPVPRNPLIYEILFQAGYVEKEGFGIKMVLETCKKIGIKVKYEIKENFTSVTLSFPKNLSKTEEKILTLIREPMRAIEIAEILKLSKKTVIKYLNKLIEKKLVKRIKKKKEIYYQLNVTNGNK